jgi:hypothetical protein
MSGKQRWSRPLVIIGVLAMLLGALDPLEGSVVILAGSACAAVGASLGQSRHTKLLSWSFALVLVGVGAMWAWSEVGGIGGTTGRSMWWALTMLPFPIGWVLGLVGVYRRLHELPTTAAA